ncbi:CoA ester lyase [Weeksellaceae bacterium KMM 9724]|uniref:HpcH/HpaI aldolase/citrate lyase family protein n=1 Tax=Profundicola chukchiensis TaxID=2961959 RepID=UPI00243D8BD8|nr:CoA ester lyase [Profundicola chukchiensis]MDG4949883.1 CoA ester lyase [Profundicola chukchiensis]
MKNQLFRSLLFVPSHNEKLMTSASNSDADILLLDIEDSVQPTSNKEVARNTVLKYLKEGHFENKILFPRINDRESGQLLKDVLALTTDGIAGFMYPKAKKGEDIYFFDKLLETVEYEKGIEKGTFKIIPLIETASAVLNVEEICRASSRVVAIAFGSEDFITDLEGIHDYEHTSLSTPRAIIAMGARAAGVIPIDTVHIRVHDLEDLEKNLIISKNLGFEGMLVLHPKELPLVHQYFSPSIQEVNDAKEMLKLAEEAEKSGVGVAIKNGKFIGPPMIKNAQKILYKHKLIEDKES